MNDHPIDAAIFDLIFARSDGEVTPAADVGLDRDPDVAEALECLVRDVDRVLRAAADALEAKGVPVVGAPAVARLDPETPVTALHVPAADGRAYRVTATPSGALELTWGREWVLTATSPSALAIYFVGLRFRAERP